MLETSGINMNQDLINLFIGIFGTVLGVFLTIVSSTVKDLHKADRELVSKVNSIEVLVAGQYIRKDEFERLAEAMFKKLDRIEIRLNEKPDRSNTNI